MAVPLCSKLASAATSSLLRSDAWSQRGESLADEKGLCRIVTKRFWLPMLTAVLLPASAAVGQQARTMPAEDSLRQSTVVRPDPRHAAQVFHAHAFNAYVNALVLEELDDLWGAAENYKLALNYYPESYELNYSLAELHYRMRDPQKALEQLTRIKKSERDAAIFRLEAASYQALGDADNARTAFLQLVAVEPDNEQAYMYLATAYRAMQKIDSTIWAYEHLEKVSPGNFRVLNELGKLYAQLQQLDNARAAFGKSIAVSQTPENILAYAGLGELHAMAREYDSAETVFQAGLEVEPDNVLLHRQLLSLYIEQDSFLLAIPHAERVVELTPLDRPSIRRLGLLYFRADSLDKADSVFTDLVQGGEFLSANHFYLGHIALRKNELERAREEFQRVVDVEDTAAQSWLDLGYVYNQLKQPEQEIASYEEGMKHVEDDTGQVRLSFALAATYERNGRWDDAVTIFERILATAPDHHQSLNYLGYMFADKNVRLDEARKLLERALALAPNNAAYLDSYGWVLYRLGEFNTAVVYLEEAATLASDPVVYEHLGDAYHSLGDADKARNWWLKARELDPNSMALKEKLEQ